MSDKIAFPVGIRTKYELNSKIMLLFCVVCLSYLETFS